MTYRQKLNSLPSSKWRARAKVIATYHWKRKKRNKKHNLAATAKYFNLSLGYVSESVLLNSCLEEVKTCKSRNQALKFLRLPQIS